MSEKKSPSVMSRKGKPTNNIGIISFADLWAMYQFVKSETPPGPGEAQEAIRKRRAEIEKELYSQKKWHFQTHFWYY